MLIRPLSRVSRVGKVGPLSPRRGSGPRMAETARGERLLDLDPPQIRQWAQRIGRDRARQILRLVERGIAGTLPELCAYEWLETRKRAFEFQSSLMGGRAVSGGAVTDFAICDLAPGGWMIWRIQGEYWHGGAEHVSHDQAQRDRLLISWYGGMPVVAVVDLWENDVYEQYPMVFVRAEVGVGLRG